MLDFINLISTVTCDLLESLSQLLRTFLKGRG